MKTILSISIFFLLSFNSFAQIPGLQWAKNIGGSRGLCVRPDAAGNVYTTGYWGGVGDFDPGPGTYYLTADGGDAYVSKLDANGNFVWAKQFGGNGVNRGVAVLPDASGNVYVAGYFDGTVDFDPGPATYNITSNGQYDIFIVKLDGNGNLIWAKTVGASQSDLGYAATLDVAGNIYVTGVFLGTVDFDPGPGVFNITGGSGVNNRCFVLKLDANGNFLQAMQIPPNYSEGDAITTDAAGNLYFCGIYTISADLNPGAGVYSVTSTGGADVFVVKLDNTGTFVWGRSFGGIGTDNCKSIKVDATGNVYLAGDFRFTVDFDPGPAAFNITAAGTADGYVLKLDVNGDFVWAKILGGSEADAVRDITLDASANIYTTGLFQGTADFDPGPGVYNLTVTGGVSNDIFISKLTTSGDFLWALKYGGNTIDEGLSVFYSTTDNLYATGYFDGVVDFDPGTGSTVLSSANGYTYIVNLNGGVLPLTLLHFSAENNATGNKLHWATAQETNTKQFEIEWSSDGIKFVKIAAIHAAGNSSSVLNYNYNHLTPATGINYYRLKMVDIDGRFTYSKTVQVNVTQASAAIIAFPNPVVNPLQLKIRASKTENVLFYLHSADGKLAATKLVRVIKGENIINWDIQSVAAGKYFIRSGNAAFPTISINKQQ